MLRHVRLQHRAFAADPRNEILPEGGYCTWNGCRDNKAWFTRDDNLKRHVDEAHLGKRRADPHCVR